MYTQHTPRSCRAEAGSTYLTGEGSWRQNRMPAGVPALTAQDETLGRKGVQVKLILGPLTTDGRPGLSRAPVPVCARRSHTRSHQRRHSHRRSRPDPLPTRADLLPATRKASRTASRRPLGRPRNGPVSARLAAQVHDVTCRTLSTPVARAFRTRPAAGPALGSKAPFTVDSEVLETMERASPDVLYDRIGTS